MESQSVTPLAAVRRGKPFPQESPATKGPFMENGDPLLTLLAGLIAVWSFLCLHIAFECY